MEKKFDQCPNCGSESRFFENMAKQLKTMGLARLDWKLGFHSGGGVIVDPVMEKQIPLGALVPSYNIATDVCTECGTLYAVWLSSSMVQKSKAVSRPNIPLTSLDRPLNGHPG